MPIFLTAAWNWLSGSKLAQWVIGISTLLLTLFLGYEHAKKKGGQEERAENSATVLETAESVKPIQDQISQLTPDEKREELSKWSR